MIDSQQSAVYQEAENRLHAQKAIMLELMKDLSFEVQAPLGAEELVYAE